MPRPTRINGSDLIYHVFARGNNKEEIFFEPGDYQRFLQNLERFREKFRYMLYAYCLLPNHFHLLVRSSKVPLSKMMQVLMTGYTMYIQKKYSRAGHVFQGRYKSIAVEQEPYLLQVVRYIHLNPVKAGLVEGAERYPWSSYTKYLTAKADIPTVETAPVLSMYAKDSLKQKQLFAEFTLAGLGVDFDPEREQVRGVLGSAKFAQRLTKVLGGSRP